MIDIINLSKKFGKVHALDDVSFQIKEGKVIGIFGINGVGKSTILKSIAGVIRPDKGKILIDGEEMNPRLYNKIAFVPDMDTYFPYLTIKDTFAFMKEFYENWDEEKATKLLEMFNLTEDKMISTLSKGNRARIKIILGFAQNAKYILLDEPFSGIDIFKREEFIKVMIEYISPEQSIIITTHEIAEIEDIVEEVVILHEGKLAFNFNVEDVRQNENKSIIDKMREVYRGE
ncbi:ABC transporter ATP-binding protein [Terrisporobacter glycolicus]|uniref:ABC transporter ATP-binding protein n=1 Tax=Terrisporobacter petrolearius TaxID=1460447 RepID=UPI0011DDA88B